MAWGLMAAAAGLMAGCGGGGDAGSDGGSGDAETPAFSLAWSEYPSWSVFGVAEAEGLIDGARGAMGTIEIAHGVDIVLNEVDYDTCLTMYGTGAADAVCITNIDALNPSMTRTSTVILPTSTSDGADALIVTEAIGSIQDLKGKKVYGLEKSVSEYAFVRNLEILGESEADYDFANMDPGAAALAMQTMQEGYDAIVVWNPFVLQTLRTREDTKVLFDSSTIPGEIVDMVVVAQEALDRPGGRDFALAVIDAFYQVTELMAAPETSDDTLIALGAKFSSLGLEDMKQVVRQTKFYKTPAEAIALLTGTGLPETMEAVVRFCVDHQIVNGEPTVGYGAKDAAAEANLRFDPSYIEAHVSGNP